MTNITACSQFRKGYIIIGTLYWNHLFIILLLIDPSCYCHTTSPCLWSSVVIFVGRLRLWNYNSLWLFPSLWYLMWGLSNEHGVSFCRGWCNGVVNSRAREVDAFGFKSCLGNRLKTSLNDFVFSAKVVDNIMIRSWEFFFLWFQQ